MKRHIKKLVTNPLFLGSAIMVIGSNSISILNYIYHLILGRLLGPTNYGELASLISLIGLLGIIPSSLNLVVVKYVSSAKDEKEIDDLINWLRSWLFKLSILFFLAIILASPAISSFLHIDKMIYLFLISLSFLFSLQTLFNRAILQGLLKFKQMMFSIFIENTTKLIVSILLVYIGFSVGGAMVAFLVATIVGWYQTNSFLKFKKNSHPTPPKNIKLLIQFIIPVFIQSISMTSLYSTDVILVKHFFSSFDVGIYAAIATLGKIIFFATGPISTVMFPSVSQRQSKGQNHSKIFITSFLATGIIAVGILIGYWFVPQFAIGLLYGKLYLTGTNLLFLYGVFITLFTLSVLLINYGLSLGRTRIVFFSLGAAIAQLILILFFHSSLQEIIIISILVTALLLVCLFIYSTYGRTIRSRNKIDLSNSSGI